MFGQQTQLIRRGTVAEQMEDKGKRSMHVYALNIFTKTPGSVLIEIDTKPKLEKLEGKN